MRNSIEYSFLQGKASGCLKEITPNWSPSAEGALHRSKEPDAKCKASVESSEKAAIQWKLEKDLVAFGRDLQRKRRMQDPRP